MKPVKVAMKTQVALPPLLEMVVVTVVQQKLNLKLKNGAEDTPPTFPCDVTGNETNHSLELPEEDVNRIGLQLVNN